MEGYFKYHQRQRSSISLSKTNYLLVSPILRHTHIRRFPKSWGISKNGYGSIPIFIPFLGEWTSINPSYFDVNYRGTRVLTHCQIIQVIRPWFQNAMVTWGCRASAPPSTRAPARGRSPALQLQPLSQPRRLQLWGPFLALTGGVLPRHRRVEDLIWIQGDVMGFWWDLIGI